MRNGVIGSTADSDSVSRGSSPFSVAGNLPEGRFLIFPDRKCVMHTFYSHRSVAQLGRALRSGRRGRRFKSDFPDIQAIRLGSFFLFVIISFKT